MNKEFEEWVIAFRAGVESTGKKFKWPKGGKAAVIETIYEYKATLQGEKQDKRDRLYEKVNYNEKQLDLGAVLGDDDE